MIQATNGHFSLPAVSVDNRRYWKRLEVNMRKILGLILTIANAEPLWRGPFYALKTELLQRFGKCVGVDLQTIVHECWFCDGLGKFHRQVWPAQCSHCGGTGAYRAFHVFLEVWDLGGFQLHVPVRRKHGFYDGDGEGIREFINGYIRHRPYPLNLSAECGYWLFLIFDREAFAQSFSKLNHSGLKVTPLVLLGSAFSRRWELIGILRRAWERILERNDLTILRIEPPDEIPF